MIEAIIFALAGGFAAGAAVYYAGCQRRSEDQALIDGLRNELFRARLRIAELNDSAMRG